MRQKTEPDVEWLFKLQKKWKNDSTKNTKELRAAMLGAALGDSTAVPKTRAKTNKNPKQSIIKNKQEKKEKHVKRGRSCKSSINA